MANTSQETVKYEVCFVQTGATSEEATEILKLAFEAMETNHLEPTWITVTDCLKISKKEPKLFILDPFEGVSYEHLKTYQCRIAGPLCILYCLQYSDVLPKRSYPVYSVSMRKITVSCSNIPPKMRDEISSRVQLMGGFFSKDLTKSVTHLVVGEVGSQKYKVAANFGLPIMVPEWISDVWENGQFKQLHASDNCYNKYKCPIFKGLVITVSQLSAEERLTLKSIIELNGGSYFGALKANQTTHLILNEPSGDKYRFAKSWRVICVNVNWIYDSIEAGYCRDETLYGLDDSLQTQPKRSTPKKDLTSCELPFVDCSAIAGNSAVSHLDETMRNDVTLPLSNRKNSYQPLDEYNLSSLPKYGQFLDGCKIFLTGFSLARMEKLRKIVNSGGGMRFSKYSDSISHVVCGELSADFKQNLKSSSVKPYIVNFNWLLECCKDEKLVDEKPFLCMDVTTLSPEKNEEQDGKKGVIAHASQNSSQTKRDDFVPDNITDIFKQYINSQQLEDNKENSGVKCENKLANLNAKSLSDSGKNRSKNSILEKNPELPQNEIPVVNLETGDDCAKQDASVSKLICAENDVEIIENEEMSSSENLFSGLKFIIAGFGQKDSEILSSMIETHSGVITSKPSSQCDIAVVPLIWHDLDIPDSNVVTNCWLQKCIEESRMYDFDENELFRPFVLSAERKPFESFVISFSQYAGTERDCLIHLAESLGATCQEYFVRRANVAKGVLSNTHLVVSTPDGSKYEASKKWKIPAVTKKWVIDAAKMGIAPHVDKYLVENFPEFPPCDELKSAENNSHASKSEKPDMSKNEIEKPRHEVGAPQNDQLVEEPTKAKCINVDKISPRLRIKSLSNSDCVEITEEIPSVQKSVDEISCAPLQHNRIAELCNKSRRESISKQSPIRQPENSLNASLSLDQTHNFKFHISGILKDLDASDSRESLGSSKRHSLPVEEMFSRNLASALRRMDKSGLEKDFDGKLEENKSNVKKDPILSGVVLYVSRKLTNIQVELNEIVLQLGGDYIWSYDNTCTHFVFIGKPNDITKEFREARAQGRKIVSPEWLYACRDKEIRVDEELYPHTYKANMTLSQQISIFKVPSGDNDEPKEDILKEKQHKKEVEKNSNKPNSNQFIKVLSGDNVEPIEDILKEKQHGKEVEKNYKKHLESVEAVPSKSEEADFNKQLNELLVAAKFAKKRHSKRVASSVSSSPVTDISPVQKIQRHMSDVYVKLTKMDDSAPEEMPDTCSQHSQSYPITWDDPTGRLEREKIAARAAKNAENIKRTSIENPKKEEMIDLDFETPAKAGNTTVKIKKFMFTNIADNLKSEYMEIVKQLGGEISDEKSFDITATHLILSNPIKNEKFLSSVASGKWVLHPQYLSASVEQKKFANEEDYEWGGPSTNKFTQNLHPNGVKIAKCPHRWRSKCEGLISAGAFDSWNVVIHADDKAKLATYTKILESGGAEIIPSDTSESSLDRISHVFVDLKKRSPIKIDLSSYLSHNIKCLKPEYLAFYLIEDPPPDVETFLVPEAKDQLSGSSTSSKRRNLSTATRQSKRTRLK